MNSDKERDKKSEELKDSDLDKVAGGAGDGIEPPPSDDEEELHGHGAEPGDGREEPGDGIVDPDKQ